MLVILRDGCSEFASGAGGLTLLTPVLESVPHLPDGEVDHGDVFDGEQARVVVDVLLGDFEQDVQIDADAEEGRVILQCST